MVLAGSNTLKVVRGDLRIRLSSEKANFMPTQTAVSLACTVSGGYAYLTSFVTTLANNSFLIYFIPDFDDYLKEN